MKLLIKNGRVLDPGGGRDAVEDILIRNGHIEALGAGLQAEDADWLIDAQGLTVCPGFIDIHVHLREPGQEHKETILTGCRSAARGGFTSIACMPNTTPVNDSVEVTRQILSRAEEAGLVNVYPVAAVSINSGSGELTDMEALVEAGVKGFTDDGRCVMNPDLLRRALEKSKGFNLPVMEHAEDHGITGDGQINEGEISAKYGLKGMPAEAEDGIVERDIELLAEVGGYLHITHLSTAGAAAAIKKAREKGLRVTSDVAPHHLLLTDAEMADRLDAVYKMKPPLRTEKDRLAMTEGIREGYIDCIATDHAPHTEEEKKGPFEKAPYGVIGMETAFPVVYDRLVRKGIIDEKRMVELFSTNPAKVLGLENRGRIDVGLPADLTILDLERPFKIDAKDFESKASNCPFVGWEGKGAVAYTIVGGGVVYKG